VNSLNKVIITILVPGAVVIGAPYLLLSNGWEIHRFALGPFRWAGLLLLLPGAIGYAWCGADFIRWGHGTPTQISPPIVLVVAGLYRFSRNPMYISIELTLFGEAVVLGSLTLVVYALFFLLRNVLFVVLYEEPKLRRQFGASYDDYCRRVPRWIPAFSRSSAP
jgi:protein-S-isoprenylcysteine O-methyltransferase Ste14